MTKINKSRKNNCQSQQTLYMFEGFTTTIFCSPQIAIFRQKGTKGKLLWKIPYLIIHCSCLLGKNRYWHHTNFLFIRCSCLLGKNRYWHYTNFLFIHCSCLLGKNRYWHYTNFLFIRCSCLLGKNRYWHYTNFPLVFLCLISLIMDLCT